MAKELRTSKYKPKTIADKRNKLKEKDAWKELIQNLKNRK
jgi:tmRNA-binding protein